MVTPKRKNPWIPEKFPPIIQKIIERLDGRTVRSWEISVGVIILAFQASDMGSNPVSLITNSVKFFFGS